MKILHLKNGQIDRKRWDEMILSSTCPLIYATSWFLDIVSPDWEALADESFTYLMPLPVRKKMGISYMYQPHFTQQLGLFTKSECSAEVLKAFISRIPVMLTDIYLNECNPLIGLPIRKTQYLNLNDPYDKIYEQYDPKLRRNLRRAEESNLVLAEVSVREIIEMFRKTQGEKLGIFKDEDYKKMEKIIVTAAEKFHVQSIGVYTSERQLIATACFIITPDRLMYFKSSSLEQGKKLRAMHWLIDKYIQKFAGQERILDFGGSVIPGIEAFYKSFGAQDHYYQHLRINQLPWFIKWLKN